MGNQKVQFTIEEIVEIFPIHVVFEKNYKNSTQSSIVLGD